MKILVNGQTATLVSSDTLIQNSSTIYTVEFEFDDSWDGYDKTIIFKAGRTEESVSLTGDVCIIPSNCLKEAGVVLKLGIFGTNNGETTDTIWFNTTRILYNWEIISGGYSAPIRSGELVNHVAKFYTSPDKSGDPAFTMNIPEEMFLDQTKTEFVNEFVWSLEEYPGSTDPDLDGKPVFVLAVKGEDPDSPPSYSFLDIDMAGGDLPADIYDMLPYTTASGNPISFSDGFDAPVKSFIVDVGVTQEEIESGIILDDIELQNGSPSSIQLPTSLSAGTYTISFYISSSYTDNTVIAFAVLTKAQVTQPSDVIHQQQFVDPNSTIVHTFTINNTANYIGFQVGGTSSLVLQDIRIIEGDTPAGDSSYRPFIPYTGVSIKHIGKVDNNLYDGPTVNLNVNNQYSVIHNFETELESGLYEVSGSFKLPVPYAPTEFTIGFYRQLPIYETGNLIEERAVILTQESVTIDGVEYNKFSFNEVFDFSESIPYIRIYGRAFNDITIENFAILKRLEEDIEIVFENEVGNVYGGKLNLLVGELTVTHGFYEFDGTEYWRKMSTYFESDFINYSQTPIASGDKNGYFSSVPYLDVTTDTTGEGAFVYGSDDYDDVTDESYYYARIRIRMEGHENDTAEEFKAYITSLKEEEIPLQAVYELAEPVIYQLNEHEIKTFSGQNDFSCSSGDINITYRANTTDFIKNQINDVKKYTEDYVENNLQEEGIGYVVKFDDVNGDFTCNKSYSEIYDRWNNYSDVVGVYYGIISSSILYSENLDNAEEYDYPTLIFSFAQMNSQEGNGIYITDIAIDSTDNVYPTNDFIYEFNTSSTGLVVTGSRSNTNTNTNTNTKIMPPSGTTGTTLLCDKTVGDVLDAFQIGANVVLKIVDSEGLHISSLKYVNTREDNGSYMVTFEFDQQLGLTFEHIASTESDLTEQYLSIENYYPDDGGSNEWPR